MATIAIYFIQTEQRLQQIEQQQEQLRGDVSKILQLLQNPPGNNPSAPAVPSRHMINGQNVMTMCTRDGYSFGLNLMDMLFTPEELSGYLVYQPKSTKSSKNGLDRVRVSCIYI